VVGHRRPLIAVLRRLQQHGLVLAVDARTGETQVHAELADPRWVEPISGTPAYLPDGRVLVGGELAHEGFDARCLFADGSLLTPPNLYVRRVCGRSRNDLIIEGGDGEPSEQHVYRVPLRPTGTAEARRVTLNAGWHTGGRRRRHDGDRRAVAGARRWTVTVFRAGGRGRRARLARGAAAVRAAPGAGTGHRPAAAHRRAVPAHPRGRPQAAGARRHLRRARPPGGGRRAKPLAGAAVVGRRRLRGRGDRQPRDAGRLAELRQGDPPALRRRDPHRPGGGVARARRQAPDLDLGRVAIRGWSFGGWLAALATLRRPDVYHCAVVGAPVTDWTLYDTAYTERYLGLPAEAPEVYAHNSLVEAATEPPGSPDEARPMLLIHGMVDDNVVSAHSLRLSAALLGAGRPHAFIPLTGATHMAAGGLAEKLLRLELDFIRRNFRRLDLSCWEQEQSRGGRAYPRQRRLTRKPVGIDLELSGPTCRTSSRRLVVPSPTRLGRSSMGKRPVIIPSVAIAVVAVAAATATAFADTTDTPSTGSLPAATGAQTLAAPQTLEAMQRDFGLTADQARARVRKERWAQQTDRALRRALGATYSGGWVNATGDQLTVAVTSAAAADQVRATGAEAKVVARSAGALDAVKARLDRAARARRPRSPACTSTSRRTR
jgi:hypothetical protein